MTNMVDIILLLLFLMMMMMMMMMIMIIIIIAIIIIQPHYIIFAVKIYNKGEQFANKLKHNFMLLFVAFISFRLRLI